MLFLSHCKAFRVRHCATSSGGADGRTLRRNGAAPQTRYALYSRDAGAGVRYAGVVRPRSELVWLGQSPES